MNELEIKRHSFEEAKNRLKEFSEKKEAEISINKVETGGGFLGLGNHKVTGSEFNSRVESIQGALIDLNSTANKTIKEFREIYNALDSLDKEYITSIIANLKAIEKTSNDVREQQNILKEHNDKLSIQQNKLESHQTQIKKNIENMEKIIASLKSFKEKVGSHKHLDDIDKMWSDCNIMKDDIKTISDSIDDLSEKIANEISNVNNKNKKLYDQLHEKIEELQVFRSNIDVIEHISDVDSTWEHCNLLDKNLDNANDKIAILENKLKYAYYISGSSLTMIVVLLVLVLTGVI